jgi:ATP-dependent Clp protease adaptor protein ClpS
MFFVPPAPFFCAAPVPPTNGPEDGEERRAPQTGVLLKPRSKSKKPSLYKVMLLNDDFTPMEFVIHVLETIFNKSQAEATDIMLHVHRRGVGLCGVYTYEVAETKVAQVLDYARSQEMPLQCTMERE